MTNFSSMKDHDLLIHVATKIEELTGNGQPGRCASHSARIARLERWRSWMLGGMALLGITISVASVVLAATLRAR